jgi:DNA polymerase-3 subunit alpha
MKNKNGGRMAFITLDDRTARLEVRVFADVYEQYQALIQPDKLVVIQGRISQDNFTGGLAATAELVYDVARAREMCGKALVVRVDNTSDDQSWISFLQTAMMPFKNGLIPVEVDYRNQDARTLISLGTDWKVRPEDTLLTDLEAFPIITDVKMKYG